MCVTSCHDDNYDNDSSSGWISGTLAEDGITVTLSGGNGSRRNYTQWSGTIYGICE